MRSPRATTQRRDAKVAPIAASMPCTLASGCGSARNSTSDSEAPAANSSASVRAISALSLNGSERGREARARRRWLDSSEGIHSEVLRGSAIRGFPVLFTKLDQPRRARDSFLQRAPSREATGLQRRREPRQMFLAC